MTEAEIRADERQRIAERLRHGAANKDQIAVIFEDRGLADAARDARTRAVWLRELSCSVEKGTM